MLYLERLLLLGVALSACGRIGYNSLAQDAGVEDAAVEDATIIPADASICEGMGNLSNYDALGAGTPADPHVICTALQYKDLANNSFAFTLSFALGADLDFVVLPAPHPMIGTSVMPFVGSFDGRGHRIENYQRIDPSVNFTAPFGEVSGGAEIRDVVFVNVNIEGDQFSGGVVGQLTNSTLTGVRLEGGSVTNNAYNLGGMIGRATDSTVGDCHTKDLGVTGDGDLGGLIGVVDVSTVMGCSSSGTVVSAGSNANVGGLLGVVDGASEIRDSHSTARVDSAGGVNVGGLIGNIIANSSVRRSYATGDVTVASPGIIAGGLIGQSSSTIIENSYATGDVTAPEDVGGLIGTANDGSITRCYATGNTTATSALAAGGLVGRSRGPISQSYATGIVTGFSGVGGLVGSNSAGDINDCFALGAANGERSVGGLVGVVNSGTRLSNSYSTGATTGSASEIGGLVGMIAGVVTDCFAAGDVSANSTNAGPVLGVGGADGESGSYFDGTALCTGCTNSQGTSASASSFHDMTNPPMSTSAGDWDTSTLWLPQSTAFPLLRMCNAASECPTEHACEGNQCVPL